jgi:predicted CXXCH cytochrome family protein
MRSSRQQPIRVPVGGAGPGASARRAVRCAGSVVAVLTAMLLLGAIGVDGAPAVASRRLGSCLTGECHAELLAARHVHEPVGRDVCGICHRQVASGGHEFKLAREASELCAFCHREIELDLHSEIAQGSHGCVLCHDPHGSAHESLLRDVGGADPCRECHADMLEGRSVLHTPVIVETCAACHDPHVPRSSDAAWILTERCLECHEPLRTELASAKRVHDPLRHGGCEQCHDAHGSTNPWNLVAPVSELCGECHSHITDRAETAAYGHVMAEGSGGCVNCHTAHASSIGAGLRADPLTLCGTCHANEITTSRGEVIAATVREIEESAYLHGPVRQRDCGACHDSHGSDHFRLLKWNYAAEFYAGFDLAHYELCFSCHPQRKVLTDRSTTLTGFRNGDLNLHYLHVNKPENGRTCRACHATHGSSQPKHIRESVPFGRWDLPIRFEETATGGRCESGCHEPRSYDRESPVDYSASSPSGETDTPERGRVQPRDGGAFARGS